MSSGDVSVVTRTTNYLSVYMESGSTREVIKANITTPYLNYTPERVVIDGVDSRVTGGLFVVYSSRGDALLVLLG